MGSFTSSPAGILGQLRGDKSIYYYTKLPADKKFYNLKTVAIKSKSIFIWTVMFDCALKLPEEFLQGLDALILKGMGSGTLSTSIIEQLSPKWTNKIPIIIVTRCDEGFNVDEYYYKGSTEKYTSKGFILQDYEQFSAVQARIRLTLNLQ